MSSIKLSPNASGTGEFTIAAPNSNTNRTLTLPDATGTFNVSGAVNEVPAGSAASPAITTSGDTNTGIFFPAADTIAFSEGGAEAVRIDSSGNVGVGTSSPQSRLQVTGQSRLGSAAGSAFSGTLATGGVDVMVGSGTKAFQVWDDASLATPRFTVEREGNVLVGTTSFSGGATVGFQINATNNTSGAYAQLIKNSSGTEIFQMRCNGGLANYSANNVNLSDARVKTDIQDAGGYLAKICAIPVRTFKYKDQTDDLLNLGCIAQEVETVAPELVDATGFGETPEDGVPLKAIYQTDLQYALMKCIQELNAKVEAQAAEIAALKGAQ